MKSFRYFLCKDCGFESIETIDDKCPDCGSENIEISYDPGERPKQWDEPGYLDFVNKV